MDAPCTTLVIAALGFPIAIALAWFFELGEPTVTRDAAADGAARPAAHGWRRHDGIVVISVLGAAVACFVARDAGLLGDTSRLGALIESSSLAVLPFANVGHTPTPTSRRALRRAPQPVLAHAEPARDRAFVVDRLQGPGARRR